MGPDRSLGGGDLRVLVDPEPRPPASAPGISILRKIAHLTEYAILGALLVRALQRPAVAILAGALYAVTDEFHQHFVRGRHAAWYDVADRHGRGHDRRARVEPSRPRRDRS